MIKNQPFSKQIRTLATGPVSLRLTRDDEKTIHVQVADGLYLGVLGPLFRDQKHALKIGDRVQLTGFTAEVIALTSDSRPKEIIYRFSVPLEEPSLRWLQWKDDEGYVSFDLPSVGESVTLAAPRRLY